MEPIFLMNVAIVIATHNRLEYTRKTIAHLLEDPNEEFDLYIWDNASSDETPEYLKDEVKDPRIVEVVLSKENVGQTGAMNYVWSRTKAELIGKLDNDCLVTPGWTRIFAKAHADIPKLGAVACWHFPLHLFVEETARKHGKIQSFSQHRIVRHPWVCGSGFIIKRETYLEQGPWESGYTVGTTGYFLRMAIAGYINGWYFPLVWQEHMDDPMSEHSMLKDDNAIQAMQSITFSLRYHNVNTIEDRVRLRNGLVRNLLIDPWEAKYYVGWRRKLRHLRSKMLRLSKYARQ